MSILSLLRRATNAGARARLRYAPDCCPRCGGGIDHIVDFLDLPDGRSLAVCKCGEFHPNRYTYTRKDERNG